MPSDVSAEAKRGPVIQGETAVEVSGRLVQQIHRKNAALRRAALIYKDCRRT